MWMPTTITAFYARGQQGKKNGGKLTIRNSTDF